MLQTVYKEFMPTQASSIYCIWVCRAPQGPLSAVWIDPAMTVFERQFAIEPVRKILDETGPGQVVDLQLDQEAQHAEEI
jgi:hypothetical protein